MQTIFRSALFILFVFIAQLANATVPSIQEVMSQALQYASLENAPLTSLAKRVRNAAWLPHIKTRFLRNSDFGDSLKEKVGDAPVRFERDFSDYGFEVEARWEFDKLLFNSEEINVAKENGRVVSQREKLIDTIVELYFNRKLLIHESQQQNDRQQKMLDSLKLEEITAKLDGLTGGWFSTRLGS